MLEILYNRIVKRCNIQNKTDCWIWPGATCGSHKWLYGQVRYKGKNYTTHRIMYEYFNGAIEDTKLQVCHTCDVSLCCNPDHLWAGTAKNNTEDCWTKGRGVTNINTDNVGTRNPNCKLEENQVKRIKQSTLPRKLLAAEYNVSKSLIDKIQTNKLWSYI